MMVERIASKRVLASSLTGLVIALSSSVVPAQQPQPGQQPGQQSAQQQSQQPPGQQGQQPGQQQAQQPGQQQAQQPGPQQAQQRGQQQGQQQAQQQPGQQSQAEAQRQREGQSAQAAGQQDLQVAAAAPGAEQALPMWTAVRMIQVKHDRIGEFEGLLKELRTAMQEAGQPPFMVYKTELGELNTYHIVAPFDSFAMFEMETPPMEPAEWANWVNRMEGTIDSHTMAIARARPDMSIVPGEQGEMQELIVLVTDKVMAGKIREYETFVRDELLPALRQGDIGAAFANEVIFGAEGRTWVYAVPIEGWQEFDGPSPIVEALGQPRAEELMLRGDALVESTETNVLRFRPDLSSQQAP